MMPMPSERARAYWYRVYVASVPLITLVLGLFGVDAAEAALWTAAVGGLLSGLLAAANTSTARTPRRAGEPGEDPDNWLDR